jgi:hypothetical protein
MQAKKTLVLGLLGVAFAGSGFTQTAPVITMDQMMTGEELRITGVGGLAPAQTAALDRWLSAYTEHPGRPGFDNACRVHSRRICRRRQRSLD